jgi:hypothetical protein
MTLAVRSELRKFFTTRLWWGMGIAVLVSGAGLAADERLFDVAGLEHSPNFSTVIRRHVGVHPCWWWFG